MYGIANYAFVLWFIVVVIMIYYTVVFNIKSRIWFWSVILTTAAIAVTALVGILDQTGCIANAYRVCVGFMVGYPTTFFCFLPVITFCSLLMLLFRIAGRP